MKTMGFGIVCLSADAAKRFKGKQPKSESRSYTHREKNIIEKKRALNVQAKQYKSAWSRAECARKIGAKRKHCRAKENENEMEKRCL